MPLNKLALAIALPIAISLALLTVALVLLLLPPSEQTSVFTCSDNTQCANGGACDAESKTCECKGPWVGARCTIYAPTPTQIAKASSCSHRAVPCDQNSDCDACASATQTPYECQQINADQNAFGEEGTFCLPVAADTGACADVNACDPASEPSGSCTTMPGKYYWTGWTDANTQAWNCQCEFPALYPQNRDTAQCTKAPGVCARGVWQYPCVPDPDAPGDCLPPTLEQMGVDPLTQGKCTCADAPCLTDDECVNACVDGKCAAQKTALDSAGVPTCVNDACYVRCNQQTCSRNNDCASACSEGGACVNGICVGTDLPLETQGKWRPVLDGRLPPLVFGSCDCPDGCQSTGTSCVC